MNNELLIAYTITAFFYITSPGPAILLAIVNGLSAGMKTVVISSFANIFGLGLLSLASILGLGLFFTAIFPQFIPARPETYRFVKTAKLQIKEAPNIFRYLMLSLAVRAN